jgi:hypothetical protein
MFNTVLCGFEKKNAWRRTGATFSLFWCNAVGCLGIGGLLVSHCTVVQCSTHVTTTAASKYVCFRLLRRKNESVFETYQAIINHTGNSQLELIHEVMWITWKKWGSRGSHCGGRFLLECDAVYTLYVRIKVFEELCFFFHIRLQETYCEAWNASHPRTQSV